MTRLRQIRTTAEGETLDVPRNPTPSANLLRLSQNKNGDVQITTCREQPSPRQGKPAKSCSSVFWFFRKLIPRQLRASPPTWLRIKCFSRVDPRLLRPGSRLHW